MSTVQPRCFVLLSSQAEPGYRRLAALLAMAGLSEIYAQISDIAPALVSERKSKKGRVAPDPEKEWKIIRWYDTSNTAQLDPEDRKYDQVSIREYKIQIITI